MVSCVCLHGPTDRKEVHNVLPCCKQKYLCYADWGFLMPLCNVSGSLSLHSIFPSDDLNFEFRKNSKM